MTPTVSIANLTATGDVVTGPGAITKLVKGLPRACMGDLVAGPVCVSGVITSPIPTTFNNIVMGRPQADLSSVVAGVSVVGVPVSTVVAVTPNINLIV